MTAEAPGHPERTEAHLKPETWRAVNTAQVRKAISEFAHERLIEPEHERSEGPWGRYVLRADRRGIEYRFWARLLCLDHWHIDQHSIEKHEDGRSVPIDAMSFIVEFAESIGIGPNVLPTYLEEIAATLYARAYKQDTQRFSATELTRAGFQEVEAAMREGHPAFVANSGRIGFDTNDYRAYAPEAATPFSLIWLAAHRGRTSFSSVKDLGYEDLIQRELDAATLESFEKELRQRGLEPEAYLLVPAHPWQWYNKLSYMFAPDLASGDLVCLGYGADEYLAQQSIRTLFNVSHPQKHYVKTALSVLNMGFMRGLSPHYMRATPAINEWIHRLIDGDSYLRSKGFSILREVAAVGYRQPHYERVTKKDSPYKKMLAALWRESPVPRLEPGQRLMTMAALLHTDRDDRALLPALIQSSDADTDTWLRRYLDCYLSPVLHCFYAHDLVFMPHGENVILVLENNVPVRAIMKDIGEETAILNEDARLPEEVGRLATSVPEESKVLSIFTDVFDGVLRFIAHVLVEHCDYPQERFWELVAECVLAYQRAHPELAEKFERHDLFAPEFRRSCLNRLQLNNNQQMIDLDDPAANLQFAGMLENPIAAFKAAGHELEGQRV